MGNQRYYPDSSREYFLCYTYHYSDSNSLRPLFSPGLHYSPADASLHHTRLLPFSLTGSSTVPQFCVHSLSTLNHLSFSMASFYYQP
jgi:hypothetical protein